MMRTICLICAVALTLSSCATKYEVFKVDDTTTDSTKGVIYSLPKTVVSVEIPIKKTAFKPGVFAKFSDELLGVNAKTSNEVKFTLGAPVISSRAIADPDQTYILKLKGSWYENREIAVQLNQLGVMTGAQTSVENKGPDLAVNIIKTTTDIVARSVLPLPSGIEGARAQQPQHAKAVVANQEQVKRVRAIRSVLERMDKNRVAILEKEKYLALVSEFKRVFEEEDFKKIEKPLEEQVRCTNESKSSSCSLVPISIYRSLYALSLRPQGIDLRSKVLEENGFNGELKPAYVEVSKQMIQEALCKLGVVFTYQNIKISSEFTKPRDSDGKDFSELLDQCSENLDVCKSKTTGSSGGDDSAEESAEEVESTGDQADSCKGVPMLVGSGGNSNPLPGASINRRGAQDLEKEQKYLESCVEQKITSVCAISESQNQILVLTSESTKEVYDLLRREQAEKLSEKIKELAQHRRALVTGNAEKSVQITGPAIEAMIRETDKALEKMISKFTGSTSKELEWKARFEIDAEKDGEKLKLVPFSSDQNSDTGEVSVLFDFSSKKGLSLKGGLAPVNLASGLRGGFIASFDSSWKEKNEVSVELLKLPSPSAVSDAIVSNETDKCESVKAVCVKRKIEDDICKEFVKVSSCKVVHESGFAYRVAGLAEVNVRMIDTKLKPCEGCSWKPIHKELASEELQIAQLGFVKTLPQSSGSILKSAFDLKLDSKTGGVSSVKVSGSALDAATIDGFGSTITGLQDRRLASKTAEDAKDTEEAAAKQAEEDQISILTRTRDILLLQDEIAKLQSPVPETGVEEGLSE